VWIDLVSARARTDATDRSAEAGGSFFDVLSVAQCGEEFLTTVQSPDSEEDPGERAGGLVTFAEDVSAVHVACSLLRLFGMFKPSTVRRSSTVRLPPGMNVIQLLGHVLVRAGERLRIEADATPSTSLVVGPWQFRVEAGGMLELHSVGVIDSVGSSAMDIRGEVAAMNCTFSRCVASQNSLILVAETNTPEGSNERPPLHGAYFGSAGGVASLLFSTAKFSATGCVVSDNAARSGRVQSVGGVIDSLGGHVVLNAGTIMRANVVECGALQGRGGAISALFSRLEISEAEFVGNEVYGRGDVGGMAFGGAINAQSTSRVTVSSTLFKENKARESMTQTSAGALFVGASTSVEVEGCSFVRNEAVNGAQTTSGGAIFVENGGFLRVSKTTFERNAVTGRAEAFGGAIRTEGSLVLGGAVVFRANVVVGHVRAAGGAIAVKSTTASLNASLLPGPVFIGNKVCCVCWYDWSGR
jgi:hypothetical protein